MLMTLFLANDMECEDATVLKFIRLRTLNMYKKMKTKVLKNADIFFKLERLH